MYGIARGGKPCVDGETDLQRQNSLSIGSGDVLEGRLARTRCRRGAHLPSPGHHTHDDNGGRFNGDIELLMARPVQSAQLACWERYQREGEVHMT